MAHLPSPLWPTPRQNARFSGLFHFSRRANREVPPPTVKILKK